MKTPTNENKFPKGKATINIDRDRTPKNDEAKNPNEYQESMREDMRGPMEGMDVVPTKK